MKDFEYIIQRSINGALFPLVTWKRASGLLPGDLYHDTLPVEADAL